MKKIPIVLLAILLATNVKSQITKHNWLVGGNSRIAIQNQTLNMSDVKSLMIQVSPNLGYFFADKFAGGVKTNIGFTRIKTNSFIDRSTSLGIGPFIRYYFMPIDKRTNLFAESSYQYLTDFDGYSQNTFIFSAGPVIYFNSSVGIEFTLNYELINTNGTTTSAKTLFLGVGLQVHLEREKNP